MMRENCMYMSYMSVHIENATTSFQKKSPAAISLKTAAGEKRISVLFFLAHAGRGTVIASASAGGFTLMVIPHQFDDDQDHHGQQRQPYDNGRPVFR